MLMMCDDCGELIYSGEDFYGIDGACLCPDCFDLWADNHKFVAVSETMSPSPYTTPTKTIAPLRRGMERNR